MNFDATDVQLTPDESKQIRELVDKASVFGERYPAEHAHALFADTPLPEDWKREERDTGIRGYIVPSK